MANNAAVANAFYECLLCVHTPREGDIVGALPNPGFYELRPGGPNGAWHRAVPRERRAPEELSVARVEGAPTPDPFRNVDAWLSVFRANPARANFYMQSAKWNPAAEFNRAAGPRNVVEGAANRLFRQNREVLGRMRAAPVFAAFRPPGWQMNAQFVLPVAAFNLGADRHNGPRVLDATVQGDPDGMERCVTVLDFGPYFDILDASPAGNLSEREKWHTSLVAEDRAMRVCDVSGRSRFRTYVTKAVHYLFNIEILTQRDTAPGGPYEWLSGRDGATRAWEHNQIVMWHFHDENALKLYTGPFRLRFGAPDVRANVGRGLAPDGRPLGRANVDGILSRAIETPGYLLWLHAPILLGFARERALVVQREANARGPEMRASELFTDLDDPVVLDPNFDLDDTPMRECEGAADAARKLARRVHATVVALHNVMRREQRDAVPLAHPDEEPDEDVPCHFPVNGGLSLKWSHVKHTSEGSAAGEKIFGKASFAGRVLLGPPHGEPNVLTYEEAEASVQNDNLPDDALARVWRSHLLVDAQRATAYSYYGTRAHLRVAAVVGTDLGSFRQNGELQLVMKPGRMSLGLEAFAPARVERGDPPGRAGRNNRARRNGIFADERDGTLSIAQAVGDYMRGISDPVIARFTAGFEAEARNGYPLLRRAVQDAMLKVDGEMVNPDGAFHGMTCTGFEVATTEFPLYHPFAMFSKSTKVAHKFFVTQGDMVGVARFEDPGAVRGRRAGRPREPRYAVVLVEHKTLMELKPPWARMVDARTSEQNMVNAHLFRMQTGIRVDCVAWMYHSRRTVRDAPPPAILSVTISSFHGGSFRDHFFTGDRGGCNPKRTPRRVASPRRGCAAGPADRARGRAPSHEEMLQTVPEGRRALDVAGNTGKQCAVFRRAPARRFLRWFSGGFSSGRRCPRPRFPPVARDGAGPPRDARGGFAPKRTRAGPSTGGVGQADAGGRSKHVENGGSAVPAGWRAASQCPAGAPPPRRGSRVRRGSGNFFFWRDSFVRETRRTRSQGGGIPRRPPGLCAKSAAAPARERIQEHACAT